MISIIIPIHNAEQYLERCLDSILRQTNRNYEVIAVVNGSKDASINICYRYTNLMNIRIIETDIAGVSFARNLGLAEAKGEYVWFVDADDYIEKSALSELSESIQNADNPDVLIFDFYIDDDGKVLSNNSSLSKNRITCLEKERAINALYDAKQCSGFVWNKVYKKDMVVGTSFSEDIHMIEDLLFNTEIFLKCNFFYATNLKLYYYCKHKGSISTIYHEKKLSSFVAYDRLIDLLGDEEQYSFAVQIVNNAKCDFARWLLCFYFDNDREVYLKVRSRYHAVIKENYRYIIGRSAKIAAILVMISPKLIKYAKRIKA